MCKEVLKEVTAAKFGKSLNVVLGCSTRWSTDFYMVTRNIRLKSALITACVDHRITKEMRNNQDVKNLILFDCETDDTFWKATERVYHLLRPVKTGIQFCEGDSVPLSVMPRIWQHVTWKLNDSSLKKLGYQEDSIAAIVNAVTKRCEMNTRPVTIASYALDPQLQGANLTESEWLVACEVILRIAESEKLDRSQILGDFTEYRTKSGTVFGNDIVWEAVTTNACSQNPHLWWLSYASSSALAKVASILLTMPATAAIIERCNKAYAVVKTKTRTGCLLVVLQHLQWYRTTLSCREVWLLQLHAVTRGSSVTILWH